MSAPPLLVTVKLTEKAPGILYVCEGLFSLLEEPSPKLHNTSSTFPFDWFVKFTVNGMTPVVVLTENSACGLTGGTLPLPPLSLPLPLPPPPPSPLPTNSSILVSLIYTADGSSNLSAFNTIPLILYLHWTFGRFYETSLLNLTAEIISKHVKLTSASSPL